ncbi:type 2 lanthipeptide synthetase LanM family protein [Mangrovibacillus sp. Mu-81]|uniref:type 2 lanthipeptide synthetase LanM family protein n=1 Tax=Mangrovibacillus sp. Mu-81 TaxID=3121478 RepID=UPI002FE4EFCA
MTTAHLYRSLSINERLNVPHTNEHKVDLGPAKQFWSDVLEGENHTYVDQMLKRHYHIDTKTLESHFELGQEPDFTINHEWFLHLCQQRDPDRTSLELDEEFENTDLSSVPFYSFFQPFLNEFYYDIFHNRLKKWENQLTYTCKNDIIKHFLDMLYAVSHKTLILEINSLRLMGKLKGESTEERYQSFYQILDGNKDYQQSLYEEYPVLFRLISTKIIHFKHFLVELFTNLEQDKRDISKKLMIDSSSSIKHLHLGSGDSHKMGRTVTIIEFEDGERLVYKPRDLSVDTEFQKFLTWVNQLNPSDNKLKIIDVLSRDLYGWSEFVTYKECSDKEEISAFYHQIGQLLAILHVMNATDFHYENIISHGKQPVLIDLESLFHHTVSPNHSPTKSEVVNKSLRLIKDSVLSTGLIPNRMIKGEGSFDVSGIGDTQSEQELPFLMDVISGQYTDEVRIEKQNGKLSPGLNNPQVQGESLNIGQYLEQITDGFSMVYSLFVNNRDELKEKILAFRGKEIRKIFRDTMKYGRLLTLSYHPDFMRNQIDREILLNRLRVKEEESIERAVDHEIADMLIGDIPYFSSTPEGKSIWSSGLKEISEFYYQDGLSLSLEKIERLSHEDLQHQLSIISATISAVYSDTDIKLLRFKNTVEKPDGQDELVKKSEEIAEILLTNAIKHEDESGKELCWTSMVTKGGNENTWVYSITGPGLYDGNPGIALYFAYLWKVTGKERYKEAAYAAIKPIIKLLPELVEPDNVNLGAYLGLSGIVYSLHHLGDVFQDDQLLSEARMNARYFEKFIRNDVLYDLIGGSSGALLVLMNLYETYREEWMLDQAEAIKEHLSQNSVHQSKGIAWIPHNDRKKEPYIGFSHGNAGITAALSRLYKYRPSLELEKLILEGIEFENTFFSEEHDNWFSAHLNKYVIAWCHGAPGILLSRCMLKENGIQYEGLLRDIRAAYKTALKSRTGKNYSFCHGDLGLIDILMAVEEKVVDSSDIELHMLKKQIIEEMFAQEQIQADINSVGLLNGIASIGYGLLRLADSSSIPSVLILDKPKNN